MAQSRNSSGRGDDRSDLDDTKALAAKARSETGGPVLRPNAAELSGMRPRRDSVVGIRVTPSTRAASGELPNWFWGLLGCLSVLLVGFAAIFLLGRSGKLGGLVGDAVSAVAAPAAAPLPVAAPAPAPAVEPFAAEEAKAPARPEHEHAPRAEHPAHVAVAAAEPAAPDNAAPAPADNAAPAAAAAPADNAAPAAAPTENAAPAPADDGAKHAARPAPAKPRVAKAGEATGDDDSAGDSAEPKAAKVARAPAAKAAGDDSTEDTLPGQDDVERALDALAPKVRGCFVKYQIKGTARVRLVATPAGAAESVTVTGDFEDTPTGLCVESVVTDAKLPTFKGAPLKLSQSYQLR